MAWGIPDVLLSDSVRNAFPFLIPFGVIGLWRWSLFALRVLFWLLYRPIRPKKKPNGTSANRYKSSDVTIIVPTIDNGEEFRLAAKYWMINRPYEIIIVTSNEKKEAMRRTCHEIDPTLFRVLSVPKPNKRIQMVVGVNAAKTDIVALSDDDAIWTEKFLEWCLAPFDDDRMGGVGSKQIMTPVDASVTFWEVIADFRLTMRMIETSASTFVDGGMSCLSGRTAIYRRSILADPVFQEAFVNETWLGKYPLHSGDDKFITRWIVKNDWKMQMQNHKEACLQTTFKNDSDFLKQVLRWTRNTWRSDFKSIFVDRKILWRYPYVAFNMCDKFINPLPMIWGLNIIVGNLATHGTAATTYVVLPVVSWLLLSRMMRLLPHIINKPQHIVYVPAMILFQYYFVFAKIYCAFTLHVTGWGSRPTVAKTLSDDKPKEHTTTLHLRSSSSSNNEADSEEASNGTGEVDIEESSNTTDESLAESDQTPKKKKFVPWYKRPAVILGTLAMSGVFYGIVQLILVAIRHRGIYWEMTLVASDKALSSDRNTGAGIYDSASQKTFLTYAGPQMVPIVMEYDHSAQDFVNRVEVADVKPNHDYHDYPSMILADDGRLVVVHTNSPESLYVSKCDTPHTSIGNWNVTKINNDNATYPCLIKTSDGDIYTFYRSTQSTDYRPLHYVKSSDHGETWSDPFVAIDSGGLEKNQDPLNLNEIYAGCPVVEPAHGDTPERFSMGWTNAGGGPGIIRHNNYHKDAHFAYFYPSTQTFATVDGESLGSSIEYDEFPKTLVFDSGPLDENNKFMVDYYFSTAPTKDGRPMMIYNFNRTLISTKWTGSTWENTVILEDAAELLFALEQRGDDSFRLFHSQGDILIFTSDNAGKTWKQEHRITPSKGASVNKVMKIADSHPDMSLVAHENDWDLYNSNAPYYLNYVGWYRLWTVREVVYNPITDPSNSVSTSVEN